MEHMASVGGRISSRGGVALDTHPALPSENERYKQLSMIVAPAREIPKDALIRAIGKFRSRERVLASGLPKCHGKRLVCSWTGQKSRELHTLLQHLAALVDLGAGALGFLGVEADGGGGLLGGLDLARARLAVRVGDVEQHLD